MEPNPLLKSLVDSYGTLALVFDLAHIAQEQARAVRATHPSLAQTWQNDADALVQCGRLIVNGRPSLEPEIVSKVIGREIEP